MGDRCRLEFQNRGPTSPPRKKGRSPGDRPFVTTAYVSASSLPLPPSLPAWKLSRLSPVWRLLRQASSPGAVAVKRPAPPPLHRRRRDRDPRHPPRRRLSPPPW